MPRFIRACIILGILFQCGASKAYAGGDINTAIDKRIAVLQTRFSIPIFYKGNNSEGIVRYEFLAPKEYPVLDHYLQLFEEEIRKYPPGFFVKKKIKAIALVRRLFRGGIPAEGAYSPDLRVMLFDVLRATNNEAKQRHSIHHEIFHMMALQPPGSESLKDESWHALNINGFVYGTQKKSAVEVNPVNRFALHQLGFVTDYAMESPPEDQAEIFACLLQKKHYRLVGQWQKKDRYLRRKVEAIKTFAASYDPDMNEGYWRRLNE